MMKFFFMMMMMMFMMVNNNFLMFYYNLLGVMSVMYMMICNLKNYSVIMNLYFSGDCYSFMMVMLMVWVVMLMMMTLGEENWSELMMFFFMALVLMLFFIFNSIFMFYFCFELSLIPIYLIIMYWGYNIERVSASYYLLMYTMSISLPLLVYLVLLYKDCKSMDFYMLLLMKLKSNLWGLIILLGSFLVKLPVFMFHSWLPKAHVEASVCGSMILAAILLKMGGYGLMRLVMIFLIDSFFIVNYIVSVGIMGSLLISLICLVQIDMKLIVAYSSVVHMNLMVGGLLSLFKLGLIGSYIMMISHGLYSSGLFYMVNLFYNRSMSRLLMMNKGMINYLSFMMIMWFLMCISNFSFPLSMGFISEIYLLSVLMMLDKSLIIYLIMVMFFSGAYSLYLFSSIFHGESFMIMWSNSGIIKEIIIIVMHLYPLIFMLINMGLF